MYLNKVLLEVARLKYIPRLIEVEGSQQNSGACVTNNIRWWICACI